MYTVDFAEIETFQHKNDWAALNQLMAEAAKNLYSGGADLIILCTNTMHLCSDAIINASPLPFIHIADATAKAIKAHNLSKVGLLGTKFTMQRDFYKRRLKEHYDIQTITPDVEDQEIVHNIIYEELVKGMFSETSKQAIVEIMNKLRIKGVEGVILGCTEIPLLISEKDIDLLLFNTTELHAKEAVFQALQS